MLASLTALGDQPALFEGAPVILVESGEFFEGPAWLPATESSPGAFYFAGKNRILHWSPWSDAPSTWASDLDNNNGNLVLPPSAGGPALISCERGSRPGLRRTNLANPDARPSPWIVGTPSLPLLQPNDLVLGPDGAIWFTDPDFGSVRGKPDTAPRTSRVLRLSQDADTPTVAASDFGLPNGLCFSPDGRHLYVGDSATSAIRRFDVDPATGRLSGGSTNHISGFPPWAPDGMKCDALGRLYVAAGPRGVLIYAPDGSQVGALPLPDFTTNLAFGDADGRTLLITTSKSVWTVRTWTAGAAWATPLP